MRILTTNKKDFSSINTIITYSSDTFPLPGSRNYGTLKTYYRYRSNEVIEKGFIEYGFNFKPDKLKYNDEFPVKMMDRHSSKILGTDYRSLEALEKVIFPTISESEESVGYGFFSSASIQSQELYVIDLPSGVTRMELYEENSVIPVNGVVRQVPAAIIEFGPDPGSPFNPDDMYLPGDPRRNSRSPGTTDKKEWARQLDEIRSKKLVWFFITTEKGQSSVNISYNVWRGDINSERNLKSYIVRNDSLPSFPWTIRNIETAGDLVIETGTGTILANDAAPDLPILNRKLARLRDNLESLGWKSGREYGQGDKVEYSGKTYISMIPRNTGNIPGLGIGWTSESTRTHFTERIQFQVIPSGSLQIPNSGPFITITGNQNKEFVLEEMAGWRFDSLYFGTLKLSEENGDYEIRRSGNTGVYSKSVIVKNIPELIKSAGPGPKNLVFSQVPSPITIEFSISYRGVYYKLGSGISGVVFKGATDITGEENLGYDVTGEEEFSRYTIKKPSNRMKYTLGQLPEGLRVSGVTKITGQNTGNTTLGLELDDVRNIVITDNSVTHSSERIIVDIEDIEYTVTVSSGPGIETSTDLERALFGSSISGDTIRFYSTSTENTGRLVIKIITGGSAWTMDPGTVSVSIGNNSEVTVTGSGNGIYSVSIRNITKDIKLEITHDNK